MIGSFMRRGGVIGGAFLSGMVAVSAQDAPKQAPVSSPVSDVSVGEMRTALLRAGSNRVELETALKTVPKAQRKGLQFLIQNMPDADLQTLSAKFLLENTAVAYEARAKALWKAQIPDAVFLNDVLPYACLNEARDNSRKRLRDIALPLIADCATPAEAAQRLNQKLFPLLKVKYSTSRNRPDQAPTETMASGVATCTGLSLLLADACRAVGVPARIVGTPLWTNGRGNHTWVEIWDGGWHFTGAAEPDGQGLDHGWFTHDASKAKKDSKLNAIYASSFQKTGLSFPMVWAEDIAWVPAVNVTERYAAKPGAADESKTRLLVKVVDAKGRRMVAKITLYEAGKSDALFQSDSKGETADLNDMAAFALFRSCPPRSYEIAVTRDGATVRRSFKAGMEAQEVLTVTLNGAE